MWNIGGRELELVAPSTLFCPVSGGWCRPGGAGAAEQRQGSPGVE